MSSEKLIRAFTGKFLRTKNYKGSTSASVLHGIISSQGNWEDSLRLYLPSFCDVLPSLNMQRTKYEWESDLKPDCSTYLFHSSVIFSDNK